MNVHLRSRRIIRQMIPKLRAEGFEVVLDPSSDMLPGELRKLRPDAIALGDDVNLVIEVVGGDAQRGPRETATVMPTGWRMHVIYAPTGTSSAPIEPSSKETIAATIATVSGLIDARQIGPAVLVGWATLEAIGRLWAPERIDDVQSSDELIEYLAHEGVVTVHEAEFLRALSRQRNLLAHGQLDADVSLSDATKFLAMLREVNQAMIESLASADPQ